MIDGVATFPKYYLRRGRRRTMMKMKIKRRHATSADERRTTTHT
jgi:hypothetical protein